MTLHQLVNEDGRLTLKGQLYIRGFLYEAMWKMFPCINVTYINNWILNEYHSENVAAMIKNGYCIESILSWTLWCFVDYLKEDISKLDIADYKFEYPDLSEE